MADGFDPYLPTIRLLVVEDSPAYLYLIQKEFRKRAAHTNWDLTVAKDGEEALHLLFEEEEGGAAALPDLILLDWNPPKVSGRDVLRRVKEHGSLRKSRCSCSLHLPRMAISIPHTALMPMFLSRSPATITRSRRSFRPLSNSG